jgi:hypothetical protein
VVGQKDRGEAHVAAPAGDLEGRHPTVKGGRAMQVEVHPNPGAPCALGHVRYYRWREGSGKGSKRLRTSKGWLLTGKERLSSRNKSAPWN